jgi:hypothetical protein
MDKGWVSGASHYGCLVERTLDKPSLRRQGRSPLKCTNSGVCITLKKKVYPLKKSLGFLIANKLSSTVQTLGAKLPKSATM